MDAVESVTQLIQHNIIEFAKALFELMSLQERDKMILLKAGECNRAPKLMCSCSATGLHFCFRIA